MLESKRYEVVQLSANRSDEPLNTGDGFAPGTLDYEGRGAESNAVSPMRDRSRIVKDSHKSELQVLGWLKTYCPGARRGEYLDTFDILCGDKRIEVKTAWLDEHGEWTFNIHRHGILNEEGLHAYIFRLEGYPFFKYAVHLVVPAPIGRKTITMTVRNVMTYWGRFFNRVDYIRS